MKKLKTTKIHMFFIIILNLSITIGLSIIVYGTYEMLKQGEYVKHYNITYFILMLLVYSIYIKLYINPNKK